NEAGVPGVDHEGDVEGLEQLMRRVGITQDVRFAAVRARLKIGEPLFGPGSDLVRDGERAVLGCSVVRHIVTPVHRATRSRSCSSSWVGPGKSSTAIRRVGTPWAAAIRSKCGVSQPRMPSLKSMARMTTS